MASKLHDTITSPELMSSEYFFAFAQLLQYKKRRPSFSFYIWSLDPAYTLREPGPDGSNNSTRPLNDTLDLEDMLDNFQRDKFEVAEAMAIEVLPQAVAEARASALLG